MSEQPAIDVRGEGEALLIVRVLEEGLAGWYGRPVRISAVDPTPMDSSTHPISRLRVALAGGEHLTVVFKRLRPRAGKNAAAEVLLYERLLAGRRFDSPALYAAVCDGARRWLFLEDLGDRRLGHCGEAAWLAASRWLGRLHAAYYGREAELVALGCLREHGEDFYRRCAGRARQTLEKEPRLLTRFDGLMAWGLQRATSYLCRQPRMLVHGALWRSNLMVQPGNRIRPIDWESAAIGVAGWDLARLLDGWSGEGQRFLAAYLDEFARRAGAPLDRPTFDATLTHCKVLHLFWCLRWWNAHQDPSLDYATSLLDEIENSWLRLEGARG
ncbi:MAG: phosphotransferase [Rubrobacteraceae bacterium]